MKSNRFALAILLAAALGFTGAAAHAQVMAGTPVRLKTKTVKPPKPKIDTFKGLVVRMDTVSITVRDGNNSYVVRTFTFSPELSKKLQKLIYRGGYQSGDKVTIKYADGSEVARSISGKASKAF